MRTAKLRALLHLREHGYQPPAGPDDALWCFPDSHPKTYNRVSVHLAEGDQSWEHYAQHEGWRREQKTACCQIFEMYSLLANYCGRCGTGVHDVTTWRHSRIPFPNTLGATEQESIPSRRVFSTAKRLEDLVPV